MELYERTVSPYGRVRYRLYNPSQDIIEDKEIESEQVVTIFCTLVISLLMSVSGQLQPHSKLAREIQLLEQAVLRFAKLNGHNHKSGLVDVGVMGWNAAVKAIQTGLSRVL